MNDDLRLIERTLNVIEACLLPPLEFDIDSQPIGKQDFNDFRVILDDQLHLLLDILYQNGNLLRDQDYYNQSSKLKSEFVILACEQTEPNEFFQTDQQILISSLQSLLEENFSNFHVNVIKNVIDHFKKQFQNDVWKKHFGSVFGFARFCELLSEKRNSLVDNDFIIFTLSVGSKLISLIDPMFRTVGLKIYKIIMSNTDDKRIKDLNIHQVVYRESFDLIKKSSGIAFNDHLFEVLYETSRLEDEDVKNSKWCKFDDIMTELLEKAGVESDAQLFLLLLQKLVKFCAITYDTIESFDDIEVVKANSRQTNYRTMRWIKKLTEFITRESTRILNNNENGVKILHLYHCIYIVSFSNVDAETLGTKFIAFIQKLILILMRVRNNYSADENFKIVITDFIGTVRNHLRTNDQLVNCLEKLAIEI